MGEGDGKSWWQSLGGTLTGIAAMITAVTGLVLALRGTHGIEADHSVPAAGGIEARTTAKSNAARSRESGARSAGVQPASGAGTNTSSARPSAPAVTSRTVSLPERREYVLGNIYNKSRYTLLSAELTRYTDETNQLTVRVRVTAEAQSPSPLGSSQFVVDIDDRPTVPNAYFTDRIPSGESRERELHFTVPASIKRTMFRIRVAPDYSAEIPLVLE